MAIYSPIDVLNCSTMRSAVHDYTWSDELTLAEAAAVNRVLPQLAHKDILDLGVGAGRTVEALNSVADRYIGVDYVHEMVAHCKNRFPAVHFEQSDARSMPQFADSSFDLIVFSCNGICMVDHAGRLAILSEVKRLLRPGGFFVFSTYNRNCKEHNMVFRFPHFSFSSNPLRLIVRAGRFMVNTLIRAVNRIRYQRHEVRHADYSILNDQCHNYQTLLYYIDIDGQKKQLNAAGFTGPVIIYDRFGNAAQPDITEDMLLYVASV
jgi:SAM-dependent methyltransferase